MSLKTKHDEIRFSGRKLCGSAVEDRSAIHRRDRLGIDWPNQPTNIHLFNTDLIDFVQLYSKLITKPIFFGSMSESSSDRLRNYVSEERSERKLKEVIKF